MNLIKLLIKSFLVIIAIMTVFLGGLMITLQTKSGQEWALKHTIAFIHTQTGLTFEPAKVEFHLPLSMHLYDLTILKEKEKLADIQQIKLDCLYPYLLQGRIIFSNLTVSGINLYSWEQEKNNSNGASYAWIDPSPLPFYVKVENLHIENMRMTPSFIHQLALNEELEHYTFNLKGMLSNNPLKTSLAMHLLFTASDLTGKFSPIQIGIDAQNSQLSLSMHTDRLPLMPEKEYNSSLALYASAPFNSWRNLAEGIPSNDSPIEGKFKMVLKDKQAIIKSKYQLLSLNEIELFKTSITTPFLELKGESSLNREQVRHCSFKGKIFQNENSLLLQGTAQGPYSRILMDLEAESPQILVHNHLISNIKTFISAAYASEIVEGMIDLEFESNEIPCKATSGFKWSYLQDSFNLHHLFVDVLQSKLRGDLTVHPSSLLMEGNLQAQANELQPIAQLAGIPMKGLVDLNLTLKTIDDGTSRHQGIDCELSGNNIHWQDFAVDRLNFSSHWKQNEVGLKSFLKAYQIQYRQTKIESGFFEIDWSNFWKNPQGRIQFAFNDVVDGALQIQEVQGESFFLDSQPHWQFKFKGQGIFNSPWQMKGEGLWHYDQNSIECHLNRLDGLYADVPLSLLQPLEVLYLPEKIQFSPLNLKWGEGELSANFSLIGDRFSLNFQTNSISSKLWHVINPLFPLIGNASAFGHLEGNLQNPLGQIRIEFQNIQISEDYLAKRPSLKGSIELAMNSKGIAIDSQIFGIGRNPFILKGVVPFQLSLIPFSIKEDDALQFSLDINAEGELDTYLHHLLKDFPNLSGRAKMALRLNGKINEPQVHGSLDITDAIYENQDTGAIYNNIQARLEGDGSKINLKTFSAEDSKGGSITGNGVVEIDAQQNYPYSFNIQASHLYILNSDYATIVASGPLHLIGKKNKGKLQGNLTVEQATVHLEEALPKEIKTIEVNYFNLPEGQQLPLVENNSTATLDLDIKLNAGEVLIEGNHLKSTWKGEVAITGNTGQPLLFGDLRISGGEYDLKGKTFNLTQGSIHFAGSPAKKTTLYVVASKEIDPIKVEMIVKGPVNKLGVSFRSNPPMSQREVLSYILFGRGISDITPGEGDTLNQSFVALNSSDSSDEKMDLLSRLRNNIGIDRLDFSASGEGENKDVTLQVGKYIWKDVLISLNKSIGAASDRVAIEAKLMKNLKAQAEMDIGSSAQGKISLKWKRDY
jgi:translocation and assembly module TamB